jgi:hypothetical protein
MFTAGKALLGDDPRASDHAAVERTGVRQASYLWVWLLSGYLILTFVPNKGEERYAQPLLPPMALLVSGAVMAIGQSWVRHAVVGLVVIIGGFNYLGLTYGLPSLPPRLSFNSVAVISHEYPHFSWVRSNVQPASSLQWPISDILTALAGLPDRRRAREIAELRRELADTAWERSSDEDVRLIYRVVLRREPDQRGLREYTKAVGAGTLSREALIDVMTNSAEFKAQRAKVLVAPDHPSFNASTLRYYAEVERLPLSFFHILDGPIDPARLQIYDFVLVKSGGYQGPEFSTRYTDQIHERLLQPGSGFVLLPERFPFADQSQIVVFVALSLLN